MNRKVLPVLVVALASACVDGTAPAPAAPEAEELAPMLALQSGARAGDVIPGQYIVVLKGGGTVSASKHAGRMLGAARMRDARTHVWQHALRGFAAAMSDAEATAMAKDPAVAFVEPDRVVTLDATQSPVPSWGLDRIDQASLPLNNAYTYTNTGAGVRAYIIDTGIRISHTDFGGRAVNGFDFVQNDAVAQDCNGHGTHVAGTVGGTQYGVAKGVTLVAVRVLNCQGSGTTSGVVSGINWVTANAVKPAVANMSLGGGASTALDNAVAASIASGVTYAIAAGNSNLDACGFSPARVPAAITVGATTSTDARASYSNFGTCVDIFAPGSSITSAWRTSNTATNTISGTSMATPHVAGAAAKYLQGNPGASPATVASALAAAATTGKVTNPGAGSPNRLLFSN